jgi:hypothetical protein
MIRGDIVLPPLGFRRRLVPRNLAQYLLQHVCEKKKENTSSCLSLQRRSRTIGSLLFVSPLDSRFDFPASISPLTIPPEETASR